MALTKTINIDGKDVIFRTSAAIPRIYRLKFGRDIFKDLMALEKSINKSDKDKSNLDIGSLELFENIAYVMAKHGYKSIPDSPEEWLDNFSTFSIYQVLPQLIELWGHNTKSQEVPKKSKTDRKTMTTPLFLLRAVELGLSVSDLSLLTIGLVNDMFTEKNNDEYKYKEVPTQDDFDKF